MKTAYSTYTNELTPLFKNWAPNRSQRTESEFCMFSNWYLGKAAEVAVRGGRWGDDWELRCAALGTHLEFLWRYRRIQHFFLAPGVADFCVSSVREYSLEYCKRLPECEPVDIGPVPGFEVQSVSGISGGFAIHFPAAERRRSVMVIPRWVYGDFEYYCAFNDGEDVVILSTDSFDLTNHDSDTSTDWLTKLVLGFSLYTDAFPDTVVEAKDDGIRKINRYSGTRNVVARNEIVDEERRNGRIPHWRIGHWRLLSSPRFVRKRGQTVYVKGAFVKGIAFEVKDDAPAQVGERMTA